MTTKTAQSPFLAKLEDIFFTDSKICNSYPGAAELVDITQGERQKEVQPITTWPVVADL